MGAPIVSVDVLSIYKNKAGAYSNLPTRMAQASADFRVSILKIGVAVRAAGGNFRLSDLYRSYEMQLQAHLDYTSGKKAAYSPAPGGSMHEAGRAFDVDVAALGFPLARFWEIAAANGVVPIISTPSTSVKECWHFERRGSHDLVRQYYSAGKGTNMKPYGAMTASAILGSGVEVTGFKDQKAAAIQSALIRLGQDIGSMDGALGKRSFAAVAVLGITTTDPAAILTALEERLMDTFPAEWNTEGVSFAASDYSDEAVFTFGDKPPAYLTGGD